MFREPVSKLLLIKALNSGALSWFGRFCYDSAAKIVGLLVDKKKAQVWTRNSYQSKQLVYGLSDIDFTLFLFDQDFQIDEGDFLRKFSLLKKIFPFLGEINIYKQSQLALSSPLINHYELERDPLLRLRLPEIKPLSLGTYQAQAEAFSYLFRMFMADQKNLTNRPQYRFMKWRRHFQAVGADLPKVEPHELKDQILDKLGELSDPNIKAAIIDLIALPYIINNSLLNSKLIIYTPQLWHQYFRGQSELYSAITMINEASFREQTFFFTQLGWELAGLLTQLPTLSDKFFQYHYHLPYLVRLLEETRCSHLHEQSRLHLIEGFSEVRRLLKNDFNDFTKAEAKVNFELPAIDL